MLSIKSIFLLSNFSLLLNFDAVKIPIEQPLRDLAYLYILM